MQNYMSTISSLHQNEIKDILMNLMGNLNSTAGGDPNEACEWYNLLSGEVSLTL